MMQETCFYGEILPFVMPCPWAMAGHCEHSFIQREMFHFTLLTKSETKGPDTVGSIRFKPHHRNSYIKGIRGAAMKQLS